MSVIAISKLYQHGKTQVPKIVRKMLNLKDGDRIYYVQDLDGRIYLEKAPELKRVVGRYVVRRP